MLKIYTVQKGILERQDENSSNIAHDAVWIDIIEPDVNEEKEVEKFIGIQIPTREEMKEIELSSRLYNENGALYMTATIITKADTDEPESHDVTFIIVNERLVTIRYIDPQPFKLFSHRMQKITSQSHKGEAVLTGLLEALIDRLADIMENIARNIDVISNDVFRHQQVKTTKKGKNFQRILEKIGLNGDLITKTQESLIGLVRLVGFMQQQLSDENCTDVLKRLESIRKDTIALRDNSNYLANKITFLLDATLGMINIQQNDIMKTFSIAAVCLMPATVITGFYGMNFKRMPQLDWEYGYEFSIFLIIASIALSYIYFRRKGWL